MPADQRLKDALRQIVGETEEDRADDPQVYPAGWADIGHVDYFYRRNTILVRTAHLDRVLAELRGPDPVWREDPILPQDVAATVERFAVIDGVTGLSWHSPDSAARAADESEEAVAAKKSENHDSGNGDDGSGNQHGYHYHGDGPPYSTPNVLARLDERLGVGAATPDHLLPLSDNGHPCPASEPAMVPIKSAGPVPPANGGVCCGTHGWDGAEVLVGVVDNGLIDDAPGMWPWMAGVRGDRENPLLGGQIAHYACHGTFVAGCVRCTAPRADVFVKRVPYPSNWPEAGAAYEHDVIMKMSELLDMGADVIVCEFAGDTRFRLPLMTFEAFYDNRLRNLNVAVLAPAGNDSTRRLRYPAAYSWATGVGALTADGHSRADFSNHGGWVDVYAPGEELVNAFAVGDYTCFEDPNTGEQRRFDGLASWSGTSFSTPLVAGMIAARMSATGENAPRAAEALLRFARSQAIPGVGPVLYPDQVCGTPREHRHAGCDCGCGSGVLS